MISNDLRGLISSMRAHVDADQMSKGFFAVFEKRLHEVATEIAELEAAAVPARLRGIKDKNPVQLNLIAGGKS